MIAPSLGRAERSTSNARRVAAFASTQEGNTMKAKLRLVHSEPNKQLNIALDRERAILLRHIVDTAAALTTEQLRRLARVIEDLVR